MTVFNYCCNVCHWVLLLLNFQDVVNEGDVIRVIPTLMYCLQFFFSHSRLSKYFEECLDFILKCEYMLSPMDRMRVLEGAFANLRGGMGSNMESDLVQENYVRNQKDLIQSLGANKTEKSIDRCTRAAGMVADICESLDFALTLKKPGSKHSTPKAQKDKEVVSRSLRELRPFRVSSGRVCQGLPNIMSSPLRKVDNSDFSHRISQVIGRLYFSRTTCRNVEQNQSDEED